MVVSPVVGKAVCSAVCPWRWGCAANGNAPILTRPNLLGEPCSSAVVPSSRMCCSLDSIMCRILHSLGPASLPSSHLINSILALPACASPGTTYCFMALCLLLVLSPHTPHGMLCLTNTHSSPETLEYLPPLQSLPWLPCTPFPEPARLFFDPHMSHSLQAAIQITWGGERDYFVCLTCLFTEISFCRTFMFVKVSVHLGHICSDNAQYI